MVSGDVEFGDSEINEPAEYGFNDELIIFTYFFHASGVCPHRFLRKQFAQPNY